jgi:signal transduction histidine kinase
VLLNLLINAQQAMPQGGTVGVATEHGAARGAARGAEGASGPADTVRVVVQDSGAGIAEEDLPHIFEPFFSTKQQKGTGLGLWVSSGIVQRHGGRLLVRSRPGRGTTFTIILPVGGPPPGPPARLSAPRPPPEVPLPPDRAGRAGRAGRADQGARE